MTRYAYSTSIFLVAQMGDNWFTEPYTLLCHHKRFQMWLPVGGEVEAGETPLQCAIREVREETGIIIKPSDFINRVNHHTPGAPKGLIGFEEHDAGIKQGEPTTHGNFIFLAKAPTTDVKLCEEHSKLTWFTMADILHSTVWDKTTDNVRWCLSNCVWPTITMGYVWE